MLSKSAIKMLKWFRKQPDWIYGEQLPKLYPDYGWQEFKALKDEKLLASCTDESDWPTLDEYDDPETITQYQISDAGRAYVEEWNRRTLDVWFTRILAILGFLSGCAAIAVEIWLHFLK